jgi:hypothetical protein
MTNKTVTDTLIKVDTVLVKADGSDVLYHTLMCPLRYWYGDPEGELELPTWKPDGDVVYTGFGEPIKLSPGERVVRRWGKR